MTDIVKADNNSLAAVTPLPLDQHPAAVYLARLAGNGRRSQYQALSIIAELITHQPDPLQVNWAALRFQHTNAILAALMDGKPRPMAFTTINRVLAALRGTLGAAFDLEQISAEDYQRAIRIKNIKGQRELAGRGLAAGEIRALMAACENDPTPAGTRDAALIALAYSAGLRRAEFVSLDLIDFDPQEGKITVIGKRNKQRAVYISNGALDAMLDWLIVRGPEPGALFPAINKGGNIQPGRMTNQAIYNIFAKRGSQAGVAKFSPHDLRRTFISDMLAAGADTIIVSKIVGHESTDTTGKYDRRPETAKKKAAELLHVPYHRRTKKN